jgi:RNA polymerase sigma-70 factor, ECF subfamily
MTGSAPRRDEDGAVVAAARGGDESAFTVLAERYRRELQVHCYRMLGSFEEAEDMVQETLLRAWRRCGTFEGRSTFRAWLYRIATNACLDTLASSSRRVLPREAGPAAGAGPVAAAPPEIPWLQPYPDQLLDEIASPEAGPDAAAVTRETIELGFLTAIQHLPPRQRAVLILRDVLAWSAAETAALLDTSVAGVNSALQRARATLRQHRPADRLAWAPAVEPSAEERVLLQRYMDAHDRADGSGLAQLLRADVRFSMPPEPTWVVGRQPLLDFFRDIFGPDPIGHMRLVPVRANRQPAAANYLRRWDEAEYHGLTLDVLRIEGGVIAEITTFGSHLFPAFGLPPALPA